MIFRTLAAVMLAAPLLLPATAHAWWGGPGHGGYYGAGPMHSAATGGFGFNSSFRGHGHGNGYNRFGGYRGYPASPLYRHTPQSVSWIIRGVNFKYDSAELTPPSMAILDSVADVVRNRPAEPLEVGGHASAEGDVPSNMALSERRAQSVRAYLVKRGIDPELLTYRGYGESRPLVANITEPGRRINRRVELTPVSLLQR